MTARFDPNALLWPGIGALCGFGWACILAFFVGANAWLLLLPLAGVLAGAFYGQALSRDD